MLMDLGRRGIGLFGNLTGQSNDVKLGNSVANSQDFFRESCGRDVERTEIDGRIPRSVRDGFDRHVVRAGQCDDFSTG